MSSFHRDLDADRQSELVDALGHDAWSDVPKPVRLNLRARKTNLDSLLGD